MPVPRHLHWRRLRRPGGTAIEIDDHDDTSSNGETDEDGDPRPLVEQLREAQAATQRERELRLRAEARYEDVRRLRLGRRVLHVANWIRLNRWAMSSSTPQASTPLFFVVGRAKSGTSWVMEALDEHPEVLCRGEGQFFGTGPPQVTPYARSLYRVLVESPELREWTHHSAWVRGADFEEEAAGITAAATERVIRSRLAASGKRIAGDKTPLNGTDVIAQIAAGIPNAKVIHIVRDGRDVAVSTVHHIWNRRPSISGMPLDPAMAAKRDGYRDDPRRFGPGGESMFTREHLAGTAKRWAMLTERAMDDGARLLGERYLEVRYESMLAEPESELVRMLRFLEVDASPKLAARCAERSSFERRSGGRSPGEEDSSSFRRKGVAGDWRASFTEDDRATFKRVAGELLIRLGYERDGNW